MKYDLDEFDFRILRALAKNCRLSNVELESEVKLSHSAISRRISKLEETGIIEQYSARIRLSAIGFSVRAFVAVSREPSIAAAELGEALSRLPGVTASYVVTGDQDIFLEVVAENLSVFADVMLNVVQTVPGVATTRSTFVMRQWRNGNLPEKDYTSGM